MQTIASRLSPTGFFNLAQGNALGFGSPCNCRLKACFNRFTTRRLKKAFSLPFSFQFLPRALPWAKMSQPVGLRKYKKKVATNEALAPSS